MIPDRIEKHRNQDCSIKEPSRLERDGFFMLIDSEAHGCCLSIGIGMH